MKSIILRTVFIACILFTFQANSQTTDTIFFEDWESGIGNWWADNGVWEIGVPTSGPGGAYSGQQCAATVLAGNYPSGANSRLITTFLMSPMYLLGQSNSKYKFNYTDENVKFTFPSNMEKADEEIISMLRHQIETQPNVYTGKLLDIEIFLLDSESFTMLVFNKANVSKFLTVDSLLNQRKQINNEALKSGYLIKVNLLEIKVINGILMLIEDFNANTGRNIGRSCTMRAIVNSVIYEFTIAGLNNNGLATYNSYLDSIIQSFMINNLY